MTHLNHEYISEIFKGENYNEIDSWCILCGMTTKIYTSKLIPGEYCSLCNSWTKVFTYITEDDMGNWDYE